MASSFHEVPKKALSPMESTDAGMSMLLMLEQLLKAPRPIFFNPSGKLIAERASADAKASALISFSVEGRTTVVAEVHLNASTPMAVTV